MPLGGDVMEDELDAYEHDRRDRTEGGS